MVISYLSVLKTQLLKKGIYEKLSIFKIIISAKPILCPPKTPVTLLRMTLAYASV